VPELNLITVKKIIYLLYAVICYLIFFATFLYFIGFISNLLVPKSIDSTSNKEFPIFIKILIDLVLISLFAVQHSVMARQGFKRKWTRIISEPIERSTYVLFSSMVVILLLFFWQPLPDVIWNAGTTGDYILLSVSFFGWGMVFLSTYLINHFHLFGLQQVYNYTTNKKQGSLRFQIPFLYKIVRHPLYLGFLIAFWAAPVMTIGHLLFTIGMTIYIFIGIYHEEKDLIKLYGRDYEQYRRKTPKIVPFTKS
jgi:methanethiol S-methyltransferase